MLRRELSVPFVDRKVVTHADITATADGDQIINMSPTASAFRYVVTTLIVEHIDDILAPPDLTLDLKHTSCLG